MKFALRLAGGGYAAIQLLSALFSIGEVEKITGVKAHILRYWEEVVPSITPQKDIGGRRTYSIREVQIIMRLRYLIQKKKFSIEGARNQIIAETDKPESVVNILQQINEIRSEMLYMFKAVQNTKK